MSRKLGVTVRVTVIGHADSTGKDAPNLGLSLARAEAVRSLLRKQGVDPELLSVRGAGPLEPLGAGGHGAGSFAQPASVLHRQHTGMNTRKST